MNDKELFIEYINDNYTGKEVIPYITIKEWAREYRLSIKEIESIVLDYGFGLDY